MNLDIQVGDRVTYKYTDKDETVIELVTNDSLVLCWFKERLETEDIEILKIERIGENGWYTVYEKKEPFLTDEEKEFLKLYSDILDEIKSIRISVDVVNGNKIINLLKNNNGTDFDSWHYIKEGYFEDLEIDKLYTLKDLGLEEEDE